MRIISVDQRSDEWRAFREEKISGTKIGELFHKSRKTGEIFDTEKPNLMLYEILAERLTVGAQDGVDEKSAMERGVELESEAVEKAVESLELKKYTTSNVWQDEENPNYICSPDAYEKSKKPAWAIEVKCLSSANHIKAVVEGQYPQKYMPQAINYFLVNPDLKTLYFVMYDPRFVVEKLQLKIFVIERRDVEYEIARLADVRDEAERQINTLIQELIR